ncbi:MAG: hypothetical protein ACYC5N_09170, partial [Endomicrobiales bacterium]
YYKNFLTAFVRPLPGRPVLGADSNRFRLNASKETPGMQWYLSYTVSPRVQDPVLFGTDLSVVALGDLSSSYRVLDTNPALYGPEGSVAVYQNLDRAYVKVERGKYDLYVGRQAVAWGTARAVNPTDILAPFRFDELDREERSGVDAVRLRFPTGPLSEIDAGYVAGRDFLRSNSALFVREKWYVLEADLTATLLDFRENLLVGFDMAGSLGGAGTYLEAAYVFSGMFDDYRREDDYFRLSLGGDYTFTEQSYAYLEYHYNGAGAAHPDNYLPLFSRPAFTEGADFYLGRHYLIPGLSYQLTPLLTASGQAIFNLQDASTYLSAQAEYNILQDVYLSLGALLGLGGEPEYAPLSATPSLLRSEFGSYDDILYSSFRVYF